MLSKEKIQGLIQTLLAEKQCFIVSLDISPSNSIKLVLDSMEGVKIEDCVAFSRAIEHKLDRDEEDFDIEVASAGLSEPFRIREQYLKNMGREVEVLLKSGSQHKGTLIAVEEEGFRMEISKKIKVEGKKKKQIQKEIVEFNFEDCSKVKVVLKF